jgi:hypothetical protein
MIKHGVKKHTQALLKFLSSSLSQQWQIEKGKQCMKFTFYLKKQNALGDVNILL